jgi:hypothetical protein
MLPETPSFRPRGVEREVQFLGSAAIDAAPVAYVVVLAAVVTTLSFVPLSVALASGGSFPMSQGVYALVGWVLGPIAGAVACGIGTLVGVLFAPHTAGVWPLTVYTAICASFAAGCFSTEKRRFWWIPVGLWGLASLALFMGRAYYVVGISPRTVVLGTFVDWSSLLLLLSPLRPQVGRWLRSPRLDRVALGLGIGTYMAFGFAHTCGCAIAFYMFNWAEEVWLILIPLIPIEFAVRSAVGAVIGVGVLSGLRAIGLVKPGYAIY